MDITSVLTNDFKVRYDEDRKVLQITTVHNGRPAAVPIEIRLDTLLEMDNPQEALAAHGFALEPADLAEIEKIRTQLRAGDDVQQQLVTIAEHYGLEP